MPELPEVETVVQGIKPLLKGAVFDRVILKRPDLRFPFPKAFADRLQSHTVLDVYRRAKYICVDLSSGKTLLWHLGMSGRVVLDQAEPDDKHDHVFFHVSPQKNSSANLSKKTDTHLIRYRDPRRFGFMDLVQTTSLAQSRFLGHLGPEPLEAGFTETYLKTALHNKTSPIKVAIMDAKVVVGVGNIYASEALFRAKIHPETPAKNVENLSGLLKAIKAVLADAIQSGGSTLRDYVRPDGELGYFQHTFFVYGKAGDICQVCKSGRIQQLKQTGRSTFFCGICQK